MKVYQIGAEKSDVYRKDENFRGSFWGYNSWESDGSSQIDP